MCYVMQWRVKDIPINVTIIALRGGSGGVKFPANIYSPVRYLSILFDTTCKLKSEKLMYVSVENLVSTWTVFCKTNLVTQTLYIILKSKKNKIHMFIKGLFLAYHWQTVQYTVPLKSKIKHCFCLLKKLSNKDTIFSHGHRRS